MGQVGAKATVTVASRSRGVGGAGITDTLALKAFAIALLAGGAIAIGTPPAVAQQLSELSCRALWYQRNAIYAERGYCFRTPDAIATFGERCYPPYGKLTAEEQRYVDQVRYWEARKGCR